MIEIILLLLAFIIFSVSYIAGCYSGWKWGIKSTKINSERYIYLCYHATNNNGSESEFGAYTTTLKCGDFINYDKLLSVCQQTNSGVTMVQITFLYEFKCKNDYLLFIQSKTT